MIKNYVIIALRNLWKYRLYTAINILGLSMSIAFSLLILLFLQNEFSFDQFYPHKNSLYRVDILTLRNESPVARYARVPVPLTAEIKEEITHVRHASRYVGRPEFVRFQEQSFQEDIYYVDPDFLQMFSLKFIEGSATTVLDNPDKIVVSQSKAKKFFGSVQAVGKTLEIRGQRLVVSGVFRDLPSNSSLHCQLIAHISRHPVSDTFSQDWYMKIAPTFIQLTERVTSEQIRQSLRQFARRHLSYVKDENLEEVIQLTPLPSIHFDHTVDWPNASNILYSYILGGLLLLIIGISCTNYILLALANTTSRSKEVGLRKVMGASSYQIRWQFWGESLILIVIALGVALILSRLALPAFNQFTGRDLVRSSLLNGQVLIGLLLMLVLMAGLAGGYPALVLSNIIPQKILKGISQRKHRTSLGNYLITFQFVACIGMMIGGMVMYFQMEYVQTKDLGFNQEQLVLINTLNSQGIQSEKILERYRNELSDDPAIERISAFQGDFGTFRMNYVPDSVAINVTVVDHQFFDALEAELVEGRFFKELGREDSFAYIINEAMAQRVEPPVIGKPLDINVYGQIVGVVKDFHFESLEQRITPAIFMLGSNDYTSLMIRISPENIPGTLEKLKRTWQRAVGNDVFAYSFLDDKIGAQYARYQQWMNVVFFASLFGIALACLGLMGLTGLVAVNRTREIGIRKVLGASVVSILYLLSLDYVKLIGFALLIAIPIANYFVSEWLQNFAYRIEIRWWLYALPGALILLIASLSIVGQTWRAAIRNPVKSLRHE